MPHAQQGYVCLQGRKLLRNNAVMPNNSKQKQIWETDYDVISAQVASTRSNTNIDYTGETALPRHLAI